MILLYPILFILLFLKYYKSKQKIPLTFFITGFYFFSSLVACYLYFNNVSHDYKGINITFHSVLFLFICIFLFIEGFSRIEKSAQINITLIEYNKIKYILILIIILGSISIYDSMSLLGEIGGMGIGAIRFAYNQNDLYSNRNGEFIAYIKSFADLIFFIGLFFSFYVFHFYPKKRYLAFLALISSTSIIFTNLTIAGRDGIVKWLLMFTAAYILFSPILTKANKRKFFIISSIMVILSLVIIIFITAQRFGIGPDKIINNMLDYYGQGFINFSKFFTFFPGGSFGGRMTFPVFFPMNERVSIANLNATFTTQAFELNVFPTFIGSFFMDFGYWGTIAVSLTFYLFFLFLSHIKLNHFSFYFLILFLFEVLASGVFYFMNYSPQFQKVFFVLLIYILYKRYFPDFFLINRKTYL